MILFNLSLKEGFELNNHEADLAEKGKKKISKEGIWSRNIRSKKKNPSELEIPSEDCGFVRIHQPEINRKILR